MTTVAASFERVLAGRASWQLQRAGGGGGENLAKISAVDDGDGRLQVDIAGGATRVVPKSRLLNTIGQELAGQVGEGPFVLLEAQNDPSDRVADLAGICLRLASEIGEGPGAPNELSEELVNGIVEAVSAGLEDGVHPLRIALVLQLVAQLLAEDGPIEREAFNELASQLIEAAIIEGALGQEVSP